MSLGNPGLHSFLIRSKPEPDTNSTRGTGSAGLCFKNISRLN